MSPQWRVDIGSTFLLKILLSFSWCLIQSRWFINLDRTRKNQTPENSWKVPWDRTQNSWASDISIPVCLLTVSNDSPSADPCLQDGGVE